MHCGWLRIHGLLLNGHWRFFYIKHLNNISDNSVCCNVDSNNLNISFQDRRLVSKYTLSAPIKDQLKCDKIVSGIVLKTWHRVFLTLDESPIIHLLVSCDITTNLYDWLGLSTNICVVLAARLVSHGIKSNRIQSWLSLQMLEKHLSSNNFSSQWILFFYLMYNWYEAPRINSAEIDCHENVFFKLTVESASQSLHKVCLSILLFDTLESTTLGGIGAPHLYFIII